MWEFRGVRQLSIKQLSDVTELTPIERLGLALKFDVDHWLHRAVKELVHQETLIIAVEDARELGADIVTKAYAVRERLRQEPNSAQNRCTAQVYCNSCGVHFHHGKGSQCGGSQCYCNSCGSYCYHIRNEADLNYSADSICRLVTEVFSEELSSMSKP